MLFSVLVLWNQIYLVISVIKHTRFHSLSCIFYPFDLYSSEWEYCKSFDGLFVYVYRNIRVIQVCFVIIINIVFCFVFKIACCLRFKPHEDDIKWNSALKANNYNCKFSSGLNASRTLLQCFDILAFICKDPLRYRYPRDFFSSRNR